jgi:hypothetical protein
MVLARRAQGDARFECIGRADVGFWRSRPDRNANASASNDDTSTGEDFSLLDEILDHLRVVSNHVCGSVGIDFVHQSGPSSKLTNTLCPLTRSKAGATSRTADTTP